MREDPTIDATRYGTTPLPEQLRRPALGHSTDFNKFITYFIRVKHAESRMNCAARLVPLAKKR